MENKTKILIELEENQPKKYRNWAILLYRDSTSYNFVEVMRIIKSHKKWAFIEHQPESNEKKAHIHVILKLDNATKKETLARKLGIGENYIDNIKSLRTMNRYLIHIDDEDKIQYDSSKVYLSKNYAREFFKSFDDRLSEDEILEDIFRYIELTFPNVDYFTATKDLILYTNMNCYDTIYKRYRTEILDYVKSICI